MKHIEGYFKGVRDTNIYYQAWLPTGSVKAVLLIIHGLGEHSGRYTNVVNYFVPLGYAVYGFDLIGHGKSGGRREYVERYEEFVDQIDIYYNMVKDWQANKTIVFFGHSVGGLIAVDYLREHQAFFKGAVISAPVIKVGEDITPTAIFLSKILSRIAPTMGVQALDARSISRDPQVVAAYVNDPLVFHDKTPARLGGELLKALQRVSLELEKITLPLIIVQASEDRLVDPAGAQMLYDRISSKDKTLKIYEGLYHEVFNEPERAHVLKDVEAWLEEHI